MSMSPIRPRNRPTPNRGSKSALSSYENMSGEDEEVIKPSNRSTRKSTRQHLFLNNIDKPLENAAAEDDCETRSTSSSTTNSNIENERKTVRENNENTPQQAGTGSRLSRNRAKKAPSSSFSVVSSINDDDKSIKLNFTRQGQGTVLTPKSNGRPQRMSVLRNQCAHKSLIYSDSEQSDDDSHRMINTRKRNASYFSKEDYEDYKPEKEEDEEDEMVTSLDEQSEKESSDGEEQSESEEEEDANPATPNKRLLLKHDLTKLALTPELLNRIEGRSIRRRIGVNSPVATGSQTMSPNPESYFLAETRVKYKGTPKQSEVVMNDAMKGKRKRRKNMMSIESRLPEKIPSDFSVTAEAMKATVSIEDYVSGNIHEEQAEKLFRNTVENDFPHWLGLFRDGFNVMLYGYGSKLSILRKFEEMISNNFLTVCINGLFPKLNSRKLLYGLCQYVNPDAPVPHGVNLEAVAKEAVEMLKKINHSDVFILINNFDNLALRFPQILSILCWLTQVPYVHILASCDTVNAFLGVTQSQALQLNFCWTHCPTYKPYQEEFKWIPGIYGDETKVVTQKSSLKYVLQSLTGNARKAFALLAQMQLKQMRSRAVQKAKEAYAGVRFQELAKECREKFIAHSDENLRTLLVEFFDHKLIRQTGKGKHLENTLLIELDIDTLEDIMSELV